MSCNLQSAIFAASWDSIVAKENLEAFRRHRTANDPISASASFMRAIEATSDARASLAWADEVIRHRRAKRKGGRS